MQLLWTVIKGSTKGKKNLPHAQEQSRDIGGWEDSHTPLQPRQHLNEDLDDDIKERNKHWTWKIQSSLKPNSATSELFV